MIDDQDTGGAPVGLYAKILFLDQEVVHVVCYYMSDVTPHVLTPRKSAYCPKYLHSIAAVTQLTHRIGGGAKTARV